MFEYKKPSMGMCEKCRTEDDLYPAGTNNEAICFSCAMKQDAIYVLRFYEMLNGGQS